MKFWTPKERQVLLTRYVNAKHINDLLPLLPGRTYDTIKSMAGVMGLRRDPPAYVKHLDLFKEPNLVNCQIMGFFAADGCLVQSGKRPHRFVFHLARKDEEYLLKIKDLLGYNGPLTYRDAPYHFDNKTKTGITVYDGIGHTCMLQIANIDNCWTPYLKNHWNIGPRKTDTLLPPNLIDIKLIMSYISGFIDGDGWIYKHDGMVSIGMMGTLEMMTWIKGVFNKLVPLGSNCKFTKEGAKNSYAYCVSGVKVYWLAKMFLSLDILRMDRKWDVLREYVAKVEAGELTTRAKNKIVKVRPSQEILDIFSIPTPS